MKIIVSPYEKVKPDTGHLIIEGEKERIVFNKDQIREMYFAVLGLQMPESCLDAEFQAVFEKCPRHISVDLPEDVIKAEIVIERSGKDAD